MSKPRAQEYGLGYDAIFDEIKSGSARAAALIAGTFVHDILQLAIKFNMVGLSKKEVAAIFDGTGPLSTFSSCIKIGYAIGLYRKNLRSDMDQLRNIRNEFAHTLHNATLDEVNLRARILGLHSLRHLEGRDSLSGNELLAESVRQITMFLIMRTTPYNMTADKETIDLLSHLEYTEDDEIKRRDLDDPNKYD